MNLDIVAQLDWHLIGEDVHVTDSRGVKYSPWEVRVKDLDHLDSMPLERIPLVLACGWDVSLLSGTYHMYVSLLSGTYHMYNRAMSGWDTLFVDVVVPYLSLRLELDS